MNFKELKKENKELKDRLNMLSDMADKQTKAFNDMCEHYENQLKIQDKELARRLILIHYLETKALKVFE